MHFGWLSTCFVPASCTFFPLSPPSGLWASLIYPVTTSILSWSWMGTGQQAFFLQAAVAAPWAVPSFAPLYAIQSCRQQSVWSGCCCAENIDYFRQMTDGLALLICFLPELQLSGVCFCCVCLGLCARQRLSSCCVFLPFYWSFSSRPQLQKDTHSSLCPKSSLVIDM